jgi:hypothetical protein
LELGAAMNFLNIFYIPLRKRVAAARCELFEVDETGGRLTVVRVRTVADDASARDSCKLLPN